jgi:uncharacterized protein
MADKKRLKIADDLILLERGRDELLLANGLVRRPLYMNIGRRYIRRFLKVVGELGSQDAILHAYPREAGLLKVLLGHGIAVPRGTEKPGNAPGPRGSDKKMNMSLYLLLSQSCNMGCTYCLDGKNSYQTGRRLKMSAETARLSSDRSFDKLAEGGGLDIVFFGGEPFLNWPLAKAAILHCERLLAGKHAGKKRRYLVTSNLTFLPTDLIEWAKKYGLSFLCDIDGPPVIHDRCRPFLNGEGSYEATVKNIRLLRGAGLRVELRATVTAVNQDYLVQTAALHKALGGQSSAFVPVNPVNSDGKFLPESLLPDPEKVIRGVTEIFESGLWKTGELYPFNQYLSRFKPGLVTVVGCGAAYGNIPVVSANGDLYPCVYLVGNKSYHLGNVKNGGIAEEGVLERLQQELNVDRLEDCQVCSWRYLCSGGCPAIRLTLDKNPAASGVVKAYGKKMRCDLTRSLLELLLWRKAEESASGALEDPVGVAQCL